MSKLSVINRAGLLSQPEEAKVYMLTLNIQNIHQKKNTADYTYRVYINDRLIENGIYKGHNREDGWAALVYGIVKLHLKKSKED